jgi:alpha-L-arabinofuranosidase
MTPRVLLVTLLCVLLPTIAGAAEPGRLTVDADRPGVKIPSSFYGLMTEEINHSYDGGLYAELIRNRIFQDNRERPIGWSVVMDGAAAGTIQIDTTNPVNQMALTRSLRLDIAAANNGVRVGVANSGYWGIPVWPNTTYRASFYARASDDFAGALTVSIESNDGKNTFVAAKLDSVGKQWKKYQLQLTTKQVATSTNNRLVISAANKGSLWFSLVSLFPPTYKNRPNGNRIDLMEKLAGLNPAFLRFPGGNYLEGNTIEERFKWKETIGPLEDRPGHQCPWGYRSSDGMGLLEFLHWCEDLNMEPVLGVYAGYSLRGAYVKPGADLEPYVQEALEEIEYVIGDMSTRWGSERARHGHPEPFKLRYVEVGNEDWFDRSGSYDGRFAQFYDAIKAKYPQLQVICTTAVRSRRPDMIDDHAYLSPRRMLAAVTRYHTYDRGAPKVFFGEWATQDGRPTPTLRAALSDAAWLTGLQKDADVVLMNCYAPLLVNVNRGASQWPTNLIGYDAAHSFGSPSYYAQAMFARAWGDTNLPVRVVAQAVPQTQPAKVRGGIGVATWRTASEYKDLTVTQGDKVVFKSDFSKNLDGWTRGEGTWAVKDGAVQQTDADLEDARLTAGDVNWTDYTLRVKARKLSGAEGFLIMFHVRDVNNYLWFNVGGWDNSRSAIEHAVDGEKAELGNSEFTVETGKWYDIRVEVKGRDIKCYVDDKLIVSGTESASGNPVGLFAAASRVDATGEVILKVVNAGESVQRIAIDLRGVREVAREAAIEVLSGNPGDVNSVAEPTKVAPKPSTITGAAASFVHEFPAHSVSVMRLKTR